MIENIKVDIVYFKTATDFEFEFNLGGCCRMRLLNDKVKDQKSFVNSLARAVSRSQIILAVGPLFGEDGLISTTAAAISHKLVAVDNKAYGIASDSKIEIIEGAVPLVTREGYFGGCIVESGNQSIVVLTENRTVRKAIMKTLVHPYIEDMCIMQSTARGERAPIAEAVTAAPAKPEPEAAPQPETFTDEAAEEMPAEPETQEAAETPAETGSAEDASFSGNINEDVPDEPEPEDGHNIEFEFSEPDGTETADGEEIADEIEQNTEDMFFMSEEDEDEEEEAAQEEIKKQSKGLNIAILVVCALLLVVVFAILYMIIFLPMLGNMSTTEYIKEIFSTASKV